jgi:hypothetical protein
MVALPPVSGVAKIVVKQQLATVNVFNVLHAQTNDNHAGSASELGNLATAVRAAWVANVIPLQNPALTLTDVVCTDLTSDTGAEATVTGSTVGTSTGLASPANAAICWSWRIARRYRGGHPRTYIGGLSSTDQGSANTITPARVTAHLAAATSLRTAINGAATVNGNWQLVVVHYRRNKAILPVPLVSSVNAVTVDTRLDSQRRRLGRDRT